MKSERKNNHPAKRGAAKTSEPSADPRDSFRDSGCEALGAVPWGTHLCQFYESKQDLLDILVPYFAAGLKSNEFCMWLTSSPLTSEEAGRALSAAVPGLAEYRRRGQIEIIGHDRWYIRAGRFDTDATIRKSLAKEDWALAQGYDGIRVSGNAAWLDDHSRRSFLDYERAMDSVAGGHKVLAVCSYPLGKCAFPDLIEVLDTHEFALVRNRGAWRKVSGGRRRAEAALRESEAKYRVFFEQVHDAILLLEMRPSGDPVIREVNPMALKMFGYSRDELVGRPVSILNESSGAVRSIKGRSKGNNGFSFVVRHTRKDGTVFTAEASGREMLIGGKLMAITVERDITERLKAEEALKRTCADLETEKELLKDKNIAFREALNAIEAEKNKMKDEFILNVNKIALPVIKRIRLKNAASRAHLELLEKSLGTLGSSFGRRLTEQSLKLTPKEIEISSMVKAGMTTKEIAGLLDASVQTIDKHRNNIRRKLGLANKGVNLVSFLQNL